MRCPSIDYPITTKLENQAATVSAVLAATTVHPEA
jgi:hypothetical protein